MRRYWIHSETNVENGVFVSLHFSFASLNAENFSGKILEVPFVLAGNLGNVHEQSAVGLPE